MDLEILLIFSTILVCAFILVLIRLFLRYINSTTTVYDSTYENV